MTARLRGARSRSFETHLQHSGNLERDLVALAESRLADQLDDLRQILLLLQDLLGARSQVDEAGVGLLVEGVKHLEVVRVGDAGHRQLEASERVLRWEVHSLPVH